MPRKEFNVTSVGQRLVQADSLKVEEQLQIRVVTNVTDAVQRGPVVHVPGDVSVP